MKTEENYNTIKFSGNLLKPGFSIYLFEINNNNTFYYYLGMTGDNYYPSARSAIHRLSGHFERLEHSTQNQMGKAIKNNGLKLGRSEITMYHFPIEGFVPVRDSLKDFKKEKLSKSEKELYDSFKSRQKEVLQLEKYLITQIKTKIGDNCLNKTKSIGNKYPSEFIAIADQILKLIK